MATDYTPNVDDITAPTSGHPPYRVFDEIRLVKARLATVYADFLAIKNSVAAAQLAQSLAELARDAAAISRDNANNSAIASAASALAASLSEAAASASKAAASASEASAKLWATAPYGQEVITGSGLYSALHWATEAGSIVSTGVIDDAATRTSTTWSSTKINSEFSKHIDIVNSDNAPNVFVGLERKAWTKGVAAFTGIIAIEITGLYNQSAMNGVMEVDLMEVGNTKHFRKLVIHGQWNNGTSAWGYGFANDIIGGAATQVRFARNTTTSKVYVLLGETTTAWTDTRVVISVPVSSWNIGLNLGFAVSTIGSLTGITTDFNISATQAINSNSIFGFKNHIINGNFDVWQRSTSQTTSDYGSDDRWANGNVGSTKTHSQVACTDTERALFNASAFSRTVVTSVAGAGNYVSKPQFIEDVTKLAGKTVTLSFWAKADSNKNIAVEFLQIFGSGGTPSTEVNGIGSQLVSLTTTWQKKTITVTLPSIVGKTLGTAGVHTSSTGVVFWFDAGSSFNARAANLGQQSGTFDIAQVQLEEGSVATPFEQRPYGLELSLCQRYYWKSGFFRYDLYIGATTDDSFIPVKLPQTMRTAPTVAVSNMATSLTGVSYTNTSRDFIIVYATNASAAGSNHYAVDAFTASAEL